MPVPLCLPHQGRINETPDGEALRRGIHIKSRDTTYPSEPHTNTTTVEPSKSLIFRNLNEK